MTNRKRERLVVKSRTHFKEYHGEPRLENAGGISQWDVFNPFKRITMVGTKLVASQTTQETPAWRWNVFREASSRAQSRTAHRRSLRGGCVAQLSRWGGRRIEKIVVYARTCSLIFA